METEKLKELIKDNIRDIVKRLAQIDRLIDSIEDYDKLDDLLYYNNEIINETLEEIENNISAL